jgi:cysteine desulfurase
MLDQYGIEASTGSACSAYDLKPSHVLLAIGQTPEFAHGSIRFSLGRENKKSDVDYVVSIFPKIVALLKSISSLTIKKYEKAK